MFDSFSRRVRRAFASVRARSRASTACSPGRGYWGLQFSVSRACRRERVYGRLAWQAWGIVAARARRWIEGWRFAWQAWGMVDDARVKRKVDVRVGDHSALLARLRARMSSYAYIHICSAALRASTSPISASRPPTRPAWLAPCSCRGRLFQRGAPDAAGRLLHPLPAFPGL